MSDTNIITDTLKSLKGLFQNQLIFSSSFDLEGNQINSAPKVDFTHPDAEQSQKRYPWIYITLAGWREDKTARMPNDRYTKPIKTGIGPQITIAGRTGHDQYKLENYATPYVLTFVIKTFTGKPEDHWDMIRQIIEKVNHGREWIDVMRNEGSAQERSEILEFHFTEQQYNDIELDNFYQSTWIYEVWAYFDDPYYTVQKSIQEINVNWAIDPDNPHIIRSEQVIP